jgi:hypothetical protein
MEKFAQFKFKIYQKNGVNDWHYQIFDNEETEIRHSQEVFKREGIARLAAIGHISLLEQKIG